jgi:SAM-dependent methyltransferase
MDVAEAVAGALGWPGAPLLSAIHPADPMAAGARARTGDEAQAMAEYFGSALSVTNLLDQLAAWSGRTLADCDAVLDFAAGYGRVTRQLAPRVGRAQLFASDIMADANEFVGRVFGVQVFASAVTADRVALPRSFDLVLANSLFSHLPADDFHAWLRRLCGALTPSGLLVFSTHGPAAYRRLHGRPLGGDFAFAPISENPALPTDRYGTSFCSASFVRDAVACVGGGCTVLAHLPAWLDGFQDVYVGGRTRPASAEFRPVPGPLGCLDGWLPGAPGEHVLAGWALSADGQARVDRVDIFGDDQHLGAATLGFERVDVMRNLAGCSEPCSGWILRHRFTSGPPRWLSAVFTDRAARTLRVSGFDAARIAGRASEAGGR